MIVAIAHGGPRPPSIAGVLFKGEFRTHSSVIYDTGQLKGWYFITIQKLDYWNKNPFSAKALEWVQRDGYLEGIYG